MKPPVAIVDMGTNTFHLLIAEAGANPRILHRDREAVKIGQGGINDGIITPTAFQRAVAALIRFKKIIDKHGVKRTLAFGTSALRNARNGAELTAAIKRATRIDTRIIDGDEEATLIYQGVRAALDLGGHPSLIMDIGGGSVEFIIANDGGVAWQKSLEVGGQRLLERFQKHDPIIPPEIEELNNFLAIELAPVFKKVAHLNPPTLVGVSGTFDTLSEMHCARVGIPYHPFDPETPLTLESAAISHAAFIRKNRTERLLLPGMIELRVDMIVVASCLLRLIVESHQFSRIRVSTWSLKEGVLSGM